MPTPTANYSFQLPTPGGDDDVWGDLLNANWTALDAQLFSGTIGADTTGNAATATTAAAATLAADATKLATARDFTIGATTRSFDGSAGVAWSLPDIGVVLADQAEAQAGTDNAKFMTPLRTAEAIAALTPPVTALSQAQVQNAGDTTFGTVSGQRLAQAVSANLPPPPTVDTASVLNATAGAAVGAVGTYALLASQSNNNLNEGQTVAGSLLRWTNALASPQGPAPSGTWRAMGRVATGGAQSSTTVFLRIS